METGFKKFKIYLKRAAILTILFVAAFFLGFYIVNLDLNFSSKSISLDNTFANVNLDQEMKNRLGSTTFGMESYGEWANRFSLNDKNKELDADPDSDGLPNYLEYVYGTDPQKIDTDGDGFSDKQEITNGYDPAAPGDAKPQVEVVISKINVAAPMVWSQSENEQNMLADLENGVSHYFHTASPGQNGNTIISGHSSNYIWAKGDYNHVFKDLNNLQAGDGITLRTVQANGREIDYHYTVSDKFIATADDQKIFADTPNPTLTLSTCWPIGTNLRRLIVKAELAK